MELIFVRHGETEFNKHKQVMGQRIDAPLDEAGLEQAHQVLAKLPNDFVMIYSSPLKRAAQTAR
jgi:broad specificity phosphatase PhoE